MVEIKSVLNDILKEIATTEKVETIKDLFVKRLERSKIREESKKSMIEGMQKKNTYFKCIKFVYDCVLKYENCGVITKSLSGGKLR